MIVGSFWMGGLVVRDIRGKKARGGRKLINFYLDAASAAHYSFRLIVHLADPYSAAAVVS